MFQGEEEYTNTILLGIPGAKLTSTSACDPRHCQIGGNPTFYEPALQFDSVQGQPQCDRCKGPLKFLAQVYAPTDIDRTLYCYGCPRSKCSTESASWKVFRMQSSQLSALPSTTITSKQVQSTNDCECKPNGSAIDWGTVCESHDAEGDVDLVALLESRDRALLVNKTTSSSPKPPAKNNGGGKSKKKQWKDSSNIDSTIKASKSQKSKEGDCEYGWTMSQIEEPWTSGSIGYDNDEDMQRRLATYLEVEEDESIKSIIKKYQSSSPSKLTSSHCMEEDNDEDIKDDEPEAFGRMVGREDNRSQAEEKFLSRVSVQPNQVLRYAFGGTPLWCTLPIPEGPSSSDLICPYCKSERKFEMQLMPGLLECVGSKMKKKDSVSAVADASSHNKKAVAKEEQLPSSAYSPIVDANEARMDKVVNACSVDAFDEDEEDSFDRNGDESHAKLVASTPTAEQITKYMEVVEGDSLNFGVVAVWSCSVSCNAGNGKEELVVVQRPADC